MFALLFIVAAIFAINLAGGYFAARRLEGRVSWRTLVQPLARKLGRRTAAATAAPSGPTAPLEEFDRKLRDAIDLYLGRQAESAASTSGGELRRG